MKGFARQLHSFIDFINLRASSSATIVEASATLVLPSTPSLITGVSENAPAGLDYCANPAANLCNFAYALAPSAQNGTTMIATPGSKLNPSTSLWDQDVYVNDQLVSTVSTSKGQKGKIFYVSIECAAIPCAAAPAHSKLGRYLNCLKRRESELQTFRKLEFRGNWIKLLESYPRRSQDLGPHHFDIPGNNLCHGFAIVLRVLIAPFER
ncbi:hypothetical protein RRF57_000942 [Xylaria bambusicola]|uniref:Uncharacterized protein n=1 Tax=Xylaria bambusicola TaxID=326684 RepID=A0AAN7UG41_9PEZI